MPMIALRSSIESRQAFEAGLQHLVDLGRVPHGLRVHPDPLPIYVLNLEKGTNAADLGAVKLSGWLYFAGDLSGFVVTGEVSLKLPPKITNLRSGDSARKILRAALDVQKAPQLRTAAFEPRFLRIPGALVDGFWLKPPTDQNGLILPFGNPLGRARMNNQPQDLDEFLRTLQPVAAVPGQGHPPRNRGVEAQ